MVFQEHREGKGPNKKVDRAGRGRSPVERGQGALTAWNLLRCVVRNVSGKRRKKDGAGRAI